jgi:hypothetical protein
MRRAALAFGIAALAACGGGPPEIPLPPCRKVGVTPVEGDILQPPEAAELRRAFRKTLEVYGYEVVELPAGLPGDPWQWTTETRKATGVEGIFRSRASAFDRMGPSIVAEAQLVDVETGRTRYWNETRVWPASAGDPIFARAARILLAGLPKAP